MVKMVKIFVVLTMPQLKIMFFGFLKKPENNKC